MKINVIVSINLLFFLFGCGEYHSRDIAGVISIEHAFNNVKTLNMSDYFTSIEYIPLQTFVESALPEITLFDKDDSNFYLAAERRSSSVAVFDLQGNYVKSIGNMGRGPGEYTWIGDMFLQSENTIAVVDNKKMVSYSVDGKWVNDFLFENLKGVESLITSVVALCNADEKNYYIIGSKGKDGVEECLFVCDTLNGVIASDIIGIQHKIERQIPISGMGQMITANIMVPSHIYTVGGIVKVFNGAADTIYTITKENRKSVEYVVDYGKYASMLNEAKSEGNAFKFDFRVAANDIIETNSIILLKVHGNLQSIPAFATVSADGLPLRTCAILFDKSTKEILALSYSPKYSLIGFYNDIDGGMPFMPSFIKDNAMYAVVDAVKFIACAASSSSVKMKEIAATLTEESNPVLIKVELK